MCLTYTGLLVELEHLKTKTRLKDEKFASVNLLVVYYKSSVKGVYFKIDKARAKNKKIKFGKNGTTF